MLLVAAHPCRDFRPRLLCGMTRGALVRLSVARASHMCVGGDRNGRPNPDYSL